METSTTTIDSQTAAALSAQESARLTLAQRAEIMQFALQYADAARAYQYKVDTDGDDMTEAAVTFNAVKDELQALLTSLTTTSVNQPLLERTLERDALIVERDALQVRNADMAIELEGKTSRMLELSGRAR